MWVQCTEAPRKLEEVKFYEISTKKHDQKKLEKREISTAELQRKSPDILLGVGMISLLAPMLVRTVRSGFEIWHTKVGSLLLCQGKIRKDKSSTLQIRDEYHTSESVTLSTCDFDNESDNGEEYY